MTHYHPSTQDRLKGAGGAALLVLAIGYGLISGLSVDFRTKVVEDLKAFVVTPPAPPPTTGSSASASPTVPGNGPPRSRAGSISVWRSRARSPHSRAS